MGQNFIACDREQLFLLPPDVRDWLPEEHFAWFVLDAVDAMDLSLFYAGYRADGHGRAAYDPAMMVSVVLYAYARGMRSSRKIERACEEDVAFRVLAAQVVPDHATVARFVVRHQAPLADLFGEVLTLCAWSGLASVTVLAVDGTKVSASANGASSVTYEQLAAAIVEEAIAIDEEEDATFGDARGDELPEALRTRQGRRGWFRDARRQLEEQRDRDAKPVPGSRPARLKDAKRRMDEELATECRANDAYERWRAQGRMRNGRRIGTGHSEPNAYTPPATPEGRINTTDLDSRTMKGRGRFIQGYNAQAVTNEHHIVIAAEIRTAAPDFGHLEPMLDAVDRELQRAGITDRPDVVLADAGYWHQQQMEHLVDRGIQVLIPPDAKKRHGERPGWSGGLYSFMRRVLETELGGGLYKRRQGMIEPVFGHTKFNRGLMQFNRRGRAAVRTEWRLMLTTHNLLKLHTHLTTPAAA